ncbi:hypothetical protein LJB42_003101 [Komagataella kurtzmanii]|nr:hypothetical protein LJB42_003101 [Komagataella kurtzmanii]
MARVEYDYDESAETWPYFVITLLAVVLIPTTISYVSKIWSRSSSGRKAQVKKYATSFRASNHDQVSQLTGSKGSGNYFLFSDKTLVFLIVGWSLFLYVGYVIHTTELVADANVFDPWEILNIDSSATEKQIKSVYRKLSLKFHPDKLGSLSDEEKEDVETKFVLINKAYKALTDEITKENFLKYGHPDGPQSVTHGIALPKFLVDGKLASPVLVVIYISMIAIALPFVVAKWWDNVRSHTRHGLHIKTAAAFSSYIINNNPAKLINTETIIELISKAEELKSATNLSSEEIEELLLAQLNRVFFDSKKELQKLKVVSLVPKLINGLVDIAATFRNSELCIKAIEAQRYLIQAVNPTGCSDIEQLLQLPFVEKKEQVSKKIPVHTLGKLTTISDGEIADLVGIDKKNAAEVRSVASSIPVIKVLKAEFKIPGESVVTPQSNAHIVVKLLIKSPAQKGQAKVDDEKLEEKETFESLRDPFTIVQEQPVLACLPESPYFPVTVENSEYVNGWAVLLTVQRDGKLADSVDLLTRGSLSNLELSQKAYSDGEEVQVTTYKLKLNSPTPPTPGDYHFKLSFKSLSYLGSDLDIPLVMNVQEPPKVEDAGVYDIEDPEEDSIAGAMATLRGEKVKTADYDDDDSASDEEDLEIESDFTDINTDTEDEGKDK